LSNFLGTASNLFPINSPEYIMNGWLKAGISIGLSIGTGGFFCLLLWITNKLK
jgi:hypothetical protein